MSEFLSDDELEALKKGTTSAVPSSFDGGFLSDDQLEAMKRGVAPEFSDVSSGSSMSEPPKPLSQRFHDAFNFQPTENDTINPLDMLSGAMGVIKRPINAAYRGVARAEGLPVSDEATPEGAIGEIVHPSGGAYTPNSWQGILTNAVGNTINPLAPLAEAIGPKAVAVSKGLTEKSSGMALDPASVLLAGGALPKAAHMTMQAGMGVGLTDQGLEALDEFKKNGVSGKFLSNLTNMGVDGLFMLSGHLSKKEMGEIEKSPEVQKVITKPPEEIDPEQIKMIDKITKAQDAEEIRNQRKKLKGQDLSDKAFASLVDKITDAQNREEISNRKEMSKPPIELPPLFPEGEINPNEVKLADTLQTEQERYPEEERFKEAREKVKEMEGGYPEDEDTDQEHVDLVDRITRAQAREEIQQRKDAQKRPIKLDPRVMEAPPEEGHLPIQLEQPRIQDIVEKGFNAKSSIKSIQEKFGVSEDEARDLYWKTKNALIQEKQKGNFPLEEFRDVPLEVASDLMPHMDDATATKLLSNPYLQKLNRFIENVFPAAKNAARNALQGARDYVEQNEYKGMGLKKNAGAYRRGYSDKNPGEHPETGAIRVNPWLLAREAAWKESQGTIPKGTAHQEFARLIQETLGHENAHAQAPHGEKGGPRDLFTGREQKGHYNPEADEKNFSFQTADQAVRNSPEFNKAFEGMRSSNNDVDLRKMYQSILKDGQDYFQKVADESVSPKKSAYNPTDQDMSMKPPPPEDETPGERLLREHEEWMKSHEEEVNRIRQERQRYQDEDTLRGNAKRDITQELVTRNKGKILHTLDEKGRPYSMKILGDSRIDGQGNSLTSVQISRGNSKYIAEYPTEGLIKHLEMGMPPQEGVERATHGIMEPLDQNMASQVPPPSARLGGVPKPPAPPTPPNSKARLGGHTPSSPQGQALSTVQPPGITAKAWEILRKTVSAGRATTVGGDVSSPFRQSWIQTFSHPIASLRNIGKMHKAMSEKGFEAISDDIRQNPYFKDAVSAKLSLTKGLIENRPEEAFEGTKVIEDVLNKFHLGKANIFTPTERAYTQYLNQTRMESFQRGMELLEGKYGKRPGMIPDKAKETLAKYVNSSTGRGKFNTEAFEKASDAMNQLLFSPRLLKSRLDVFNPMEWKRMYENEPVVAKMAATELAKSAAFVGSMVAAANAAGAKVEKDWRSPDFGKIRVGNHTIDPWGGYQQYIRYGAQFIFGQRKNQYGQIKDANRGDTIGQFLRSKLAPVPGFIYSAAKGKNMIGRRTSSTNPMSYVEAFAPMTFRDVYELGKTDPVLATAMALPISLGIGVVSREPLPASKEVKDEYERLMVPPPADAQTIQLRGNGKTIDPLTGKGKYETRPLTDKEFEGAKEKGDKMAFSEIEKYIQSPSYKELADPQKRIALNNLSRKMGVAKRKLAAQLALSPPPK